MSEAERIVREFAACRLLDPALAYSDQICPFCDKFIADRDEPEPHEPDCLWLRARAWVERADETIEPLTKRRIVMRGPILPSLPDAHAIGRARLRDVLGLHPATERADYEDGRNPWRDEDVRRGLKDGGQ